MHRCKHCWGRNPVFLQLWWTVGSLFPQLGATICQSCRGKVHVSFVERFLSKRCQLITIPFGQFVPIVSLKNVQNFRPGASRALSGTPLYNPCFLVAKSLTLNHIKQPCFVLKPPSIPKKHQKTIINPINETCPSTIFGV